jgi:4-hydroxy-tetrahydrodipicolinate synthase
MSEAKFRGSITALITPFKNGEIDEKSFQDFVKWQLDEGSHGVVPCGTTGENPVLSDEESERVIRLCLGVAKGRVPVIAGCGSNCTSSAVEATKAAEKLGADAALHVVPYYNKPTQEGIYAHFKEIHDKTGLPIVLYNVPGRTVASLSVETLARLAELPRIVGIKDATGDLQRPLKTRRMCGAGFIQLSGNDDTALAFLASGGVGCISVLSNVAPALCARMQDAWSEGNIHEAQEINYRLSTLAEALFIESSPAPVKYAVSLLGKCRNELRLPLVPATKKCEDQVREAMKTAVSSGG